MQTAMVITVYMLRKGTGWYCRSSGYYCHWTTQQCASVWTSKQGPAAAKGQWLRNHGESEDMEIVPFTLKEIS